MTRTCVSMPYVHTHMRVTISPYGSITACYGVTTLGFGVGGSKGVGKGSLRLEM